MRSFRVSCTLRASPAEVRARDAFAPRLPAAGGLQALVLEAAFRWRHRRLRRIWGAA